MNPEHLITMRLRAAEGHFVPLASFNLAVVAWQRILDEFLAASADAEDVHWEITHLETSDSEMGLTAQDRSSPENDRSVGLIGEALVDATTEIQAGAELSSALPRRAVAPFRQLARAFDDCIVSITFEADGRSALITADIDRGEPTKHPVLQSVGSVEGTVQGISFDERKPYFSLANPRGDRAIKVYFDRDAQFDTVVDSLQQSVTVRGQLWRRTDGSVHRVDALRSIVPTPVALEQPPISELIGSVPDLTGGLSSDAWLRRQRSGE